MRKVFCVILICLSVSIPSFTQTQIINKIIAKVGGEIILYSDWQEQIGAIKEKNPVLSKDDECGILQNIIIQKFMVHQAKLDSIEVKDEEIEAQLNARIEQILSYMNNNIEQFEQYYGMSISEVRSKFRDDLKGQLLAERLQAKVLGEFEVTPTEVKAFYHQIPKDSLPYFNTEVEVSEIVVKPKLGAEQIATARNRANEILAKLKNGESFESLAKKYSEDPGSSQQGGNLGWMKRGNLVSEYEAVAFNLETDSISGIVESEFGLHIIQLLGRRGNNINTRHILIKPKFVDEDYTKSSKLLDSVRLLIMHDSINFTEAVRQYSDKNAQSYSNGGRLVNPKTESAYFEIADLEPDIYFALDKMQVGEISKPIEFTDIQDNSKYYRIIKLLSRSKPHKANLTEDYHRIASAAKDAKKAQEFNMWLMKKLPTIFLEVEPDIQAICPALIQMTN